MHLFLYISDPNQVEDEFCQCCRSQLQEEAVCHLERQCGHQKFDDNFMDPRLLL